MSHNKIKTIAPAKRAGRKKKAASTILDLPGCKACVVDPVAATCLHALIVVGAVAVGVLIIGWAVSLIG